MKLIFLLLYSILVIIEIVIFYILNIEYSMLIALIVTIFSALLFGYILYDFINEQKSHQDKVLEHIVQETLHEINLPINTIEANINMLIKSLENQKDIKKAKRVNQALDRLKRLYQQLSYNIKKEILDIEEDIINLEEIVKDRVSYFREFNRNNFIINTKPLIIKVDKIGLEQAIDNILENAMKYSGKNSDIIVKIDNDRLIIKDFGIGIEQDELSLIYQRYYQSNSLKKGDGIGLSIVKNFCDRNKIALNIKSKKGFGTKVIFDFKNKKMQQN